MEGGDCLDCVGGGFFCFMIWIKVRHRIDIWDVIGGAPRRSGEIGRHWDG